MADLYTALRVSPKKKRTLPSSDDDEDVLTPKRLRRNSTVPSTPSTVTRRKANTELDPDSLPAHLSRLHKIQTSLQHGLSHALATCAVSPSEDTGIVRNVLNHMSLGAYTGLTTRIDIDDLKRLCWLWEWDGKALPSKSVAGAGKGKAKVEPEAKEEDENPFLDRPKPAKAVEGPLKDWTRGAMGFVVSQTTHRDKVAGARFPVYGLGIEVEMDIDKDMKGGMAAVARWTAGSETRRKEIATKLQKWVKLHAKEASVPQIPMADLPSLPEVVKPSNLTRLLASSSPKSPASASILAASQPPSSPSRSASRSPTKSPNKKLRDFAIPFPLTPSSRLGTPSTDRIMKTPSTDRIFKTPSTNRIMKTPSTNRILFPQTPSSRHSRTDALDPRTPTSARTPSLAGSETPTASDSSVPSTPVHQRGPNAETVPQTPTSSRRQALYERIRQRSLQNTPTKANPTGAPMSKDQLLKLSQEEMRRRCLLGRLSGVAESVWMFFSNPIGLAGATPGARKRRAMPASEIVAAVVKSSPVPLSIAEAHESLDMLVKICPFFIRRMDVSGEEWLEMPASAETDDEPSVPVSPRKGGYKEPGSVLNSPRKAPSSPSKLKIKDESAEDLLTRSPRRVKREGGGLREVRERIRKELESLD
ncbi:hypothetical protein L226DRAFT_498825 [Lentinus tigrinus ALCF2SS1-7]|uniref:DNA replication factor Cdt1 C-terminal domain-containing protein n=1 Tax=Lentinus tigrinus ALCF2SS1-6 TaxID=1328759 RepID=A0A5C2STN9_9APHY|nr:hypothetical protein L227DRAFT_537820 [Lentinus tigrinus ALCF2SS1-6]RPD80962.1 hypothetical protein L226DRAFT_498825 [Lentinus tigrinus ALCF2SS1-7]